MILNNHLSTQQIDNQAITIKYRIIKTTYASQLKYATFFNVIRIDNTILDTKISYQNTVAIE